MKILVVEDNPQVAETIMDYLELAGHRLDCAYHGQAALQLLANHLVADGLVADGYLAGLQAREAQGSTFLGQGIAIPHGTPQTRDQVFATGVRLMQFPEGVEWNPGQVTRLVVGIAAQSDTHITLLRRLTRLIQDDATLQRLFTTADASEIVNALAGDVIYVPEDFERISFMKGLLDISQIFYQVGLGAAAINAIQD